VRRRQCKSKQMESEMSSLRTTNLSETQPQRPTPMQSAHSSTRRTSTLMWCLLLPPSARITSRDSPRCMDASRSPKSPKSSTMSPLKDRPMQAVPSRRSSRPVPSTSSTPDRPASTPPPPSLLLRSSRSMLLRCSQDFLRTSPSGSASKSRRANGLNSLKPRS